MGIYETVKCPNCGAEIDHLDNYSNVWEKFIMTLGKNDTVDYKTTHETVEGNGQNTWDCPKCGETIANSEEEAIKILKQNKVWNVS